MFTKSSAEFLGSILGGAWAWFRRPAIEADQFDRARRHMQDVDMRLRALELVYDRYRRTGSLMADKPAVPPTLH